MTAVPPRPSLARLAAIFLRVGNTTFGGGDPTIAALQRELTTRRPWLSPEDSQLCYALARVTPGTNMLAFCAGVAWRIRGWLAALAAVLAVTVPSSVLVVLLTEGYQSFHSSPRVMAAVNATQAAAVGLMFAVALALIRPRLSRSRWPRALFFPLAAAGLVIGAGWSPLKALGLLALLGFLWPARGLETSPP